MTHRVSRRIAALLTAVALGAAGTALAGCSSEAPPTDSAPTGHVRTAEPKSDPGPKAQAVRQAPTELSIPSIGVRSSLMELGLNADGTVEVPPAEKGMTAGWYTGGSAPGEPGPAVLIGHNDTRFGRAVFHDLKNIRKDAKVLVRDGTGKTLRFRVTAKESVAKKAFPTEKVYGPTKGSTLRLITCDGDFDAEGHPVDNLIVYGVLG
ncbi:class F sortase [Streptomyces sp. WZ.A104]|uniref:class F sortase n=1 Tax=Streptomyces sp. WZ.A104 TaxID=2023771 RepID=UPI00211C1177|nr:class F sortase [Streptomyces sp. WZ.A104]